MSHAHFDRSTSIALAALFVALFVPGANAQSSSASAVPKSLDWRQYRFDVAHTGSNPFEHVLSASNVAGLKLKWTAQTAGALGGGVQASPTVVDGVAWVLSQDGHLYVFDAISGAPIAAPITGGYGSSTPAIVGDRVFVGAVVGAYAFPTSCVGTCGPIWHSDTHTTINPPMTVAGGRIYASNYWGYLDVLDVDDGHLLWSTLVNPNEPIYGPVAVSDGLVFVPANHGLFAYSLDCASGCAPTWTVQTPYSVSASPAVAGGSVYATTDQGQLLAVDAHSGATRWTAQVSALPSPAALADGLVVIGGNDGTLRAFRQNSAGPTAQPVWSVSTGEPLYEPVIANGLVYTGSLDGVYTKGHVFVFRLSDGALVKSILVNGAIESGITVVHGRIYFGTLTGLIACYGL